MTVILRSERSERLEGWKDAWCLWPSFETVARKGARPPQDDVAFVSRSLRMTK